MRRILFIAAIMVPTWANAQPKAEPAKAAPVKAVQDAQFKAPPLDDEGPDDAVQAVACLDCQSSKTSTTISLQRLPTE